MKVQSLELTINDTTKDKDDYICVSSGQDRPHRTLEIMLEGSESSTDTKTVNLKSVGDGKVEFSNSSPDVQLGQEKQVKVFGQSKSSSVDSTKIEATVQSSSVSETENLTVFKGVKLTFNGTFYSNVDTRVEERRPWDGRTTPPPSNITDWFPSPTPGERTQFSSATTQDKDFGYKSAISFKKGDNGDIPKYRPWAGDHELEVKTVEGMKPSIELVDDPLKGVKMEMKSGFFEGTSGSEFVKKPQIVFPDFFEMVEGSSSSQTRITPTGNSSPKIPLKKFNTQINDAKSNYPNFSELIGILEMKKNRFHNFVSPIQREWENDTLEINSKSNIKSSMAAQCIINEKETGGQILIKMLLHRFNEFTLQGEIKDGIVKTK